MASLWPRECSKFLTKKTYESSANNLELATPNVMVMGMSDMADLTLKYAQPYIFVNAPLGCRDR